MEALDRTCPQFRISDDHFIFAVAIQFLAEPDWHPFRFHVGYRVQWHDTGQQFSNDRYHYILVHLRSRQLEHPGTNSRKNVGRLGLLKWRQQFDPDIDCHLTFVGALETS